MNRKGAPPVEHHGPDGCCTLEVPPDAHATSRPRRQATRLRNQQEGQPSCPSGNRPTAPRTRPGTAGRVHLRKILADAPKWIRGRRVTAA
jgi:hypothetical protein